ncbi:unnamed protein product [marine sediment metagenome]|uniref:Peptidase A2 domain-containing protein n=1 Tax=marine sediment metagenome TaxID=412755 RepID=X0WQG0_9ZZZZ
MGTSAIIRVPASNLVAPPLRDNPLIASMEPTEGFIFFLLDTGADITCLSFLDARKLGIETKYLEQDDNIIGVGGECCAYKLNNIEIGLIDEITKDRVQFHIEGVEIINVLDEAAPKMPSLLGNDILKRFDIATIREKGKVTLSRIKSIPGKYRIASSSFK